MALTVKKTHAVMPGSLNLRTEFHGDEEVGACDFTLSGIVLWEDDVDELYDSKGYWQSLFKPKSNPPEPRTRKNGPMDHIVKYKNSTIKIWFEGSEDDDKGETVTLTECKIRKVTLDPQTGGGVTCSLQVQCNPDSDIAKALYERRGMECSAQIRFGKEDKPKQKEQPELPLSHTPANGADADQPTVN